MMFTVSRHFLGTITAGSEPSSLAAHGHLKMCRAYGARMFEWLEHPALTRWAKLFRACGADFVGRRN